VKAIHRSDAEEKVGVIVRRNQRIAVQEYSELPARFEAPLAHIGLFCFSLSFIERIGSAALPWHIAQKQHGGRSVKKFERFLFDVLDYTDRSGVLIYPREDVYAPLKNLEGRQSLADVQKALSAFDRRLLSDLAQTPLPSHAFELDPAFYYPTPALKKEWKGKQLSSADYIHP
jgi:UDP-N-acetylglucosamine/UDP-N-acetylgalactosamine diphosphorylase